MYQKRGLAGSVGIHSAWNFWTVVGAPNLIIRLLLRLVVKPLVEANQVVDRTIEQEQVRSRVVTQKGVTSRCFDS